MNKPGFNRLRTQELVTFFCDQAAALCKNINEVVKDECYPHSDEDIKEGKKVLILEGKDIRQGVREDNFKLYELMDGPIKFKLFNNDGDFIWLISWNSEWNQRRIFEGL